MLVAKQTARFVHWMVAIGRANRAPGFERAPHDSVAFPVARAHQQLVVESMRRGSGRGWSDELLPVRCRADGHQQEEAKHVEDLVVALVAIPTNVDPVAEGGVAPIHRK